MIPGILGQQIISAEATAELIGTASLTFTPSADLEIAEPGELNGLISLAFTLAGNLEASAALGGTTALTFTPAADLDAITAEHQYWRVNITNNGGGSNLSCAELKAAISNGGANIAQNTSLVTSMASSSNFAGTTADNTTDWSTANNWATNDEIPGTLRVDFGTAKIVTQVGIRANGTTGNNQSPVDFTVDYSDDDSAWTTQHTETGSTGWALAEERIFDIGNTSQSHRYWRVRATAVDGGTRFGANEIVFGVSDGLSSGSTTAAGRRAFASASSTFGGETATRAIDGNTTNGWTNSTGATGWLKLDFLRKVELHEMKWTSRSGEGNRSPTAGTIEWSDDDSSWTSVYTISEAGWGSLEERTWQF